MAEEREIGGVLGLLDTEVEEVVAVPYPQPDACVSNEAPMARSGSSRMWLYATIILCCYGFFKEFKASEPFLTPYLVDDKKIPRDEVCITGRANNVAV